MNLILPDLISQLAHKFPPKISQLLFKLIKVADIDDSSAGILFKHKSFQFQQVVD